MSRMLTSRQCSQYFRALVNENKRDAKFTRSDFKNKLRFLYFINYNSLLIYFTMQRGRKMDFGYERAVTDCTLANQLCQQMAAAILWKLNVRNDRGKKISIIQ